MKKLLILILVLCALGTTARAQTQCKLKLADLPAAPELFGFHLGMTMAETKTRVPQIVFGKPDPTGVSKTTINPGFDSHMDQTAFTGVRSISLEFLDDKLSSVWLGYESGFKWHTVEDFVSGISESLHLPNAWEPWRTRGSQMRCADFQIVVSTIAAGASFHLIDQTAADALAERREALANEEPDADENAMPVVGDKRAKVYYFERCKANGTVASNNRVNFATRADAEKAGYKLAKNCE